MGYHYKRSTWADLEEYFKDDLTLLGRCPLLSGKGGDTSNSGGLIDLSG